MKKINKHIDRFFKRPASNEEKELLESWRDEAKDNLKELEEIVRLQSLQLDDYKRYDGTAFLNQLVEAEPQPKQKSKSKLINLSMMNWVAAASLLFVVSLFGYRYFNQSTISVPGDIVYTTSGDFKDVILEDKSKVFIDKDSRVTVLKKRTLAMEGRAFFEVEKNRTHPFTVATPIGRVEVLGTKFSVEADSNVTEVFVEEGRVRFDNGVRSVILVAGDLIRAQGSEIVKVKNTEDNYLSWHTQTLRFNGSSLSEIARDLQDCYGTKISIDPSVNTSCTFTSIYKDASLKSILEELKKVLGLKYSKDGKSIRIIASKC